MRSKLHRILVRFGGVIIHHHWVFHLFGSVKHGDLRKRKCYLGVKMAHVKN